METIYLALRAQIAVGNFFMKSMVSKGQIIKIYEKSYNYKRLNVTKNNECPAP